MKLASRNRSTSDPRQTTAPRWLLLAALLALPCLAAGPDEGPGDETEATAERDDHGDADAHGEDERRREPVALGTLLPWRAGDTAGPWEVVSARLDRGYWRIEMRGPDGPAVVHATPERELPDGEEPDHSFIYEPDAAFPGSAEAAAALASATQARDRGDGVRLLEDDRILPPEGESMLLRLARDGVLWIVVFLVALALCVRAALRHPVRDEPLRQAALILAGITVGGLVLRLALAPSTVMGPYPFRTHLIARMVWEGPGLLALGRMGLSASLFELISAINLLFAAVAPLAVYACAVLLSGRQRVGLFAAALLAFLPQHIHFSASEVAFVPLVAGAPLMLALALVSLGAERTRARIAWTVLLAMVAAVLCGMRPLAPFLAGVAGLAALAAGPRGTPLTQRLPAILALGLAAAVGVYLGLRADFYGGGGSTEEALENLAAAATGLFRPSDNLLLVSRFTPVTLVPAALVGLWAANRHGATREGLLLLAWFVGFYVVGGVVLEPVPEMRSRYQLAGVAPVVLLGGWGLAWLGERVPWLGRFVLLVTVAQFPAQLRFVMRDSFDIQREQAFVVEGLEALDDGCVLVEASEGSAESVFERNTLRIGPHGRGRDVGTIGLFSHDLADYPDRLGVQLAWAMAASQTSCVLYFDGLACAGRRGAADFCLAPQLSETVTTVVEAEMLFGSNPYEGHAAPDLEPGEPITLRWIRWRGARETQGSLP